MQNQYCVYTIDKDWNVTHEFYTQFGKIAWRAFRGIVDNMLEGRNRDIYCIVVDFGGEDIIRLHDYDLDDYCHPELAEFE